MRIIPAKRGVGQRRPRDALSFVLFLILFQEHAQQCLSSLRTTGKTGFGLVGEEDVDVCVQPWFPPSREDQASLCIDADVVDMSIWGWLVMCAILLQAPVKQHCSLSPRHLREIDIPVSRKLNLEFPFSVNSLKVQVHVPQVCLNGWRAVLEAGLGFVRKAQLNIPTRLFISPHYYGGPSRQIVQSICLGNRNSRCRAVAPELARRDGRPGAGELHPACAQGHEPTGPQRQDRETYQHHSCHHAHRAHYPPKPEYTHSV